MESDEGRPAERSRWEIKKPNRGSTPSSASGGFKRWLSNRWGTVLILAAIVFLALFVRSYFGYSTSVDGGFLIAGGYDAYFHQHIINHILSEHSHLLWDEAFNYPIGMNNPIPPLYDWSVALTGQVISAVSGMSAVDAASFALVLSSAVWGSLTCIPIFLLGKTLLNKKVGFMAAFLYAIMAGSVIRTVFSEADYFGMALFFATFALYFMIRALQGIKGSKVVGSWKLGFQEHLNNKRSLIFAALAGTCLATIAFMWTGYTYLVSIVLIWFLIQAIICKFRNQDITGSLVLMIVMLGISFILIAPAYYQLGFMSSFTPAFLLFLGTVVLGMISVFTKDLPWILSLPIMLVILIVGLVAISLVWPGLLSSVLFGVEYSLYKNISLTSATFSRYVLSFGAVTFWLAIIGAAWAVLKIRKSTYPVLVFAAVATILSMYLATASSGFIYLATPVFAVASAWILVYVIDKLHFENISRNLTGFWSNPTHNLRKVFNLKHVVGVIFVVLMILVPNAWGAVDAGIPYSDKESYDEDIFNAMPDFLHPSGTNSYDDLTSLWYLGAFSYYLTSSDSYMSQALDWLSKQDVEIVSIGGKPAVMVWNGHGSQVVQQGNHPVVSGEMYTDAEYTSAFLTAKSENEAIALLAIRALEYDYSQNNNNFSSSVRNILGGELADKLLDIFQNPSNYIKTVLDDPETYGHRTNDLSAINAKYAVASHELAASEDLIRIYGDLIDETGLDFGYFMFDSSVYPLSYQSQGMFYMAASLSDYVLDSYTGAPTDFYSIAAYVYDTSTSSVSIVDVREIPAGASVLYYLISYTDTFYNSMIYKAYMGSQTSSGAGYPGAGLAHFKHVYQTAYYNPYSDDENENYASSWRIISYEQAKDIQAKIDAGEWTDEETGETGTVDFTRYASSGGAVFLEYFKGAVLEGTVTSELDNIPLVGVHVSVIDENGIVHDIAETDENGEYTVYLPYGDINDDWNGIKVVYSIGTIDNTTGIGSVELDRVDYRVTYAQAMWEEDFTASGDSAVYASAVAGKLFWDLNGNGRYDGNDEVIAKADVTLSQPDPSDSSQNAYESIIQTDDEGNYSFVAVPGDKYNLHSTVDGHEYAYNSSFTIKLGANYDLDIAVTALSVSGNVTLDNGSVAQNLGLTLVNTSTGKKYTATTDNNGTFTFEKMPIGTYKLIATGMDVGTQVVELTSKSVTGLEITISEYVSVSGNITGGSSDKTMWIESIDGTYSSEIQTSGSFTAILPSDMEFSVYVSSGNQAYLGKLSTENFSGNYNITLSDATLYEGVVNYSGTARADAFMMFMNSNGAYHAVTSDADGKYSILLPNGSYTVYASSNGVSYWGDISETIDLTQGMSITGTVRTGSTAIPGATVSIVRDNKTIFTATAGDGTFTLAVPAGDYTVTVSEYGYRDYTGSVTASSSAIGTISMTSVNVTVSGNVTGVPADTSITFRPSSGSSQTVDISEDGTYSVALSPGTYTVTVDKDLVEGTSKYYYSGSLTVGAGAYVSYNIDVPVVYNTTVNLTGISEITSGTIYFIGDEENSVRTGTSLESSIYLAPGRYTVYASVVSGSSNYAALTTINVSNSNSHSIAVSSATEVGGSLNGSNESVDAIITNSSGLSVNAVIDRGSLETLYLPNGSYTIALSYHDVDDETGKYVEHVANYPFQVAGSRVNITIDLTDAPYLAQVSGTTNMNWSRYQILPLSDTASEPSADAVRVNGTEFSMNLAPGLYSLYAVNGMNVYFGTFEVSADGDNTFDAILSEGRNVTINVNNRYNNGAVDLIISDNARYRISGVGSAVTVVLPNGEYLLEAVYQTTSGNRTDVYSAYGAVTVNNSSASATLTLQQQTRGAFEVSVGSSQTINQGGTAEFRVTITNTGNVNDRYELSSIAGEGWEVSVQEQVSINAGNSTTVLVRVTAPDNALVDHEDIMLKVKSLNKVGAGETETELNVTVNPAYYAPGVTITQSTADGSSVTFTVAVENTSNIEDSFTVDLMNKSSIESAGWTVDFDTEDLSDIDAGETKTVTITLERGDNARNNVSINVRVTSETDSSKVTTQTAQMSSAELSLDGEPAGDGPGASASAPAMPGSMWIVLALIVLLLVAIVIVNVNKGVFGRRRKR